MKAREHRAIGDAASGGAVVDLAPPEGPERLLLGYGDVIALSGDFFLPTADDSGLFSMAASPVARNEILGALRVMAVDEASADARFDPGGEFGDVELTPTVERSVRDRFLALAAANADHFVTPWAGVSPDRRAEVSRFASAPDAYRRLHEVALDEACRLGRSGGGLPHALAREAAAQHYLTDAFASGHLRTPIAAIRAFWRQRYPSFWEALRLKVASGTAAALLDLAWPLRLLPRRVVLDRTHDAVRLRTDHFPPISLGDLLARVFHDWDNEHGLVVEGGGVLYGDGRVAEGVGQDLAIAAVRAGNDDVEVAFGLGASGSRLRGEALYASVREATGSPAHSYRAECHIPRPSLENPPLNWRAADVDELWRTPIVGSRGTTVGDAVAQVVEEGGEVSRRLDCLGQGVVEAFDLLGVPGLDRWLSHKACLAYHAGFIRPLAEDPRGCVAAVVEAAEALAGADPLVRQ